MRQAGRYLPEYAATRKRAGSFLRLAQNPDLATEVTLQPLDRYALDAAILFSDILTIPDALGLGLYFVDGEGPRFERPLCDEAAINALPTLDLDNVRYVFDAVAQIRRSLANRVPLIGFSGSPWTLACYMIEGGASHDFRRVKTMLYDRPDLLRRVLEINTSAVTNYLNAQIEAGAQVVMIFDTWGGALADGAYQAYSLSYMQQILAGLRRKTDAGQVPCIIFTKGGGMWLEEIAATEVDAIGVDWTVNLGQARRRVGAQCALQGNLDPTVLFAQPEKIRAEARKVLESFAQGSDSDSPNDTGHAFNLGHGVSQFTPPEAVGVLVDAVHEISREMRGLALARLPTKFTSESRAK